MKIIYYSPSFFSDCDFPLIKELQEKGIDVHYYIPLHYNFKSSSILEFDKPIRKWGIYKASGIKEMQAYKECLDLDRLYLICGFVSRWWFVLSWLLYMYVLIHMYLQKADVFHFTWQFNYFERLLFLLRVRKKIMTVHDPTQHSGLKNMESLEKSRIRCFRWADKFILLNSKQLDEFSLHYDIKRDNIMQSHLGVYNAIAHMNIPNSAPKSSYIIFFGQITPHKGLEFLLKAMGDVHKRYPDVKLLIAGRGSLYFDVTPFKDVDYIIWENRYIGIHELTNMVRNSLLAVCPYKDATQSGVIQTALALDVPVVATDVGSLPLMVKDGVYGRIVPACNSKALGLAICELIDSPTILKDMRDNIVTQWIPAMSWSPIANDYIKLYNVGDEECN